MLNIIQQDGKDGNNIVVKKASRLSSAHVFALSVVLAFHIHFLLDGFPLDGETKSLFARELVQNSLEKKTLSHFI